MKPRLKINLNIIVGLTLFVSIVACQPNVTQPTATAKLISTPIPNMPQQLNTPTEKPTQLVPVTNDVQLDNVEIKVVKVEQIQPDNNIQAPTGFKLIRVTIDASGTAAMNAQDLWVNLLDGDNQSYEVLAKGAGSAYGGANYAGWTFAVPDNATGFKLLLLNNQYIDLAPFIKQ